MKNYRVEVAYRTKRGGVCVGMTVKAKDEDDAGEQARMQVLKGYPARKHAYTITTEDPTHAD